MTPSYQSQVTRSAALVVSAALRDDDATAGRILRSLPPEVLPETAVAAVCALAEILRDNVPPHAVQAGVNHADLIVQIEELEGNHP